MSRFTRLLREVEMGDADSFMEIVRELENSYRKSMYITNTVDTGELVLIKSCTYILLDKTKGLVHILLEDEGKVVTLEAASHVGIEELSEEICGMFLDEEL